MSGKGSTVYLPLCRGKRFNSVPACHADHASHVSCANHVNCVEVLATTTGLFPSVKTVEGPAENQEIQHLPVRSVKQTVQWYLLRWNAVVHIGRKK